MNIKEKAREEFISAVKDIDSYNHLMTFEEIADWWILKIDRAIAEERKRIMNAIVTSVDVGDEINAPFKIFKIF